MYTLKKRVVISSSHQLTLDYTSKCRNIHGHNWIIEIEIKEKELNSNGMIIDFTKLKSAILKYDHTHLNHAIKQPTAENLARTIYDNIQQLIPTAQSIKIMVQESEGNQIWYTE